jgi:hypothetical protein
MRRKKDSYGVRWAPDPLLAVRRHAHEQRRAEREAQLRQVLPRCRVPRINLQIHGPQAKRAAKSDFAWRLINWEGRPEKWVEEHYPVTKGMWIYREAILALRLRPRVWSWDYARGFVRGFYGLAPGQAISRKRIDWKLKQLRTVAQVSTLSRYK